MAKTKTKTTMTSEEMSITTKYLLNPNMPPPSELLKVSSGAYPVTYTHNKPIADMTSDEYLVTILEGLVQPGAREAFLVELAKLDDAGRGEHN